MQMEKPKQKARIPMMVDDPKYSESGMDERDKIERHDFHEDYFLDGPVSRRVAVLDFSEKGDLLPGVPYQGPEPGRKLGRYKLNTDPGEEDPISRDFNRLSVFATVLKTLEMFERKDVLGREVRWAFGAPQLMVVPRAGQMENAFYERDSHSLQFFFFPSYLDNNEIIYTSLARDIVAHETGHAILDGIAPHLWLAITPESRALHEAIADLTALLMSIDSPKLRHAVLQKTNGSIKESTHFSAVAEQFGMARGTGALRNLYDETLTVDPGIRDEPHDLCRVLAAALYSVLVKMHDDRKQQRATATGKGDYEVSGWALATAAAQFCRMTMRALDYLPPGEISFADYGRAIIASDQAAHPDDSRERAWICDEFVRRGMVQGRPALQVDPPPEEGLKGVDLQALMDSDWVAYDFANSVLGRRLLTIPDGVRFHIEPRLLVERESYRECLFKVWWYHTEENPLGAQYPGQRQIAVGTTMAWDRDTGQLRVVLTSNPDQYPDEHAEKRADRDAMLRRLVDEGSLRPGPPRLGPDGRPLRFVTSVEATSQIMRVSNVARTLCFAREV